MPGAEGKGKEKKELLLNIIGLLQGDGCCTEKKASLAA